MRALLNVLLLTVLLGDEKRLSAQMGSPLAAGAEALKSTFWGMAPAVGTQKPEPWAKKWIKIHRAIDARGSAL